MVVIVEPALAGFAGTPGIGARHVKKLVFAVAGLKVSISFRGKKSLFHPFPSLSGAVWLTTPDR
jgi:hypothetical protein